MTTDKTGSQTSVAKEDGRFTISVDGRTAGAAEFADRDGQRVFFHTEVADEFEGRGLATILVREALTDTRDEGKRIVAVCSLVASFVEKHPEFSDAVDPATPEITDWLRSAS